MARYRSRRTSRRTASQSAASLLALALPAPVQRVADTRLGPLLMLVGLPCMLVAGYLQINWSNGLPTVVVDPQAASKAIAGVEHHYNNFDRQGGLEDLGHAATDFLNGVSHSSHSYGASTVPANGWGQSAFPTTQPTAPARNTSASFPSTQPSTGQRDFRYTTTQPTGSYAQQSSHNSQPTYAQQQAHQQTYAQHPSYSQPGYSQSGYSQSGYSQSGYTQPGYSQPSYSQQVASPSDQRTLTQQQLYQQQQQQIYEQQLREQQYRQWLAQQASTQQPTQTGAQQSYDAYGRPVSTGYSPTTGYSQSNGYAQPAAGYTQPASQYGQPNYNQSYVPSANTHGRY